MEDEISVGPTLNDLARVPGTECISLAPATELDRCRFVISDPIDTETAQFGHLLTDPSYLRMHVPSVRAVRVQEATILGNSGVVLLDGAALYDTLFDLAVWRPESMIATFEAGHSLRLKAGIPELRRLPDGVYVAGFGGGWSNYAHWMQQTLPRLAAFLQLKPRYPDLRLILPAFPPGSFQAQTLQLLGITRDEIVIIDHHSAVSVHDVWLIDRPDIWTVAPFFRVGAALLDRGIVTGSGFGPNIYIRRGTGLRTVANFSELAPVLACRGFAVVDFDVMPLDQQIATMRGARRIVGEHGAGLINIMFCREGAGVIELFNPACVQPAFWSVASVCALRYGFLVGVHSRGGSNAPGWNTDYIIDPARLESAIRALV